MLEGVVAHHLKNTFLHWKRGVKILSHPAYKRKRSNRNKSGKLVQNNRPQAIGASGGGEGAIKQEAPSAPIALEVAGAREETQTMNHSIKSPDFKIGLDEYLTSFPGEPMVVRYQRRRSSDINSWHTWPFGNWGRAIKEGSAKWVPSTCSNPLKVLKMYYCCRSKSFM